MHVYYIYFKIYFCYFNSMYVCVSVCAYVHVRNQKRASNS